MASDLGIKTVFYSVFIALSTAFLTVPSRLPNPTTYPTRDFLYMFESFHGKPCVYDRVLSSLKGCSVILAKTCNERDARLSQFGKPVLLVGPVTPEARPNHQLEDKWDNWLDRFEGKSVIYFSFGGETFLSDDLIKELALGLELTGLPFFMVLNFPANAAVTAELRRALPEGFVERVEGEGQILAHPSVGCYLSHAVFSSVIEGLVNDCQLVMLPQKGDQFLNSKLVSWDLKAGVEVNKRDEDGYFGKDDIKRAVEKVMFEFADDDVSWETGRENHKKWRSFLLDRITQDNLITGLEK
ncbi:hypothetical protein ABFX02_14G057750 [Erythranthe guttata]